MPDFDEYYEQYPSVLTFEPGTTRLDYQYWMMAEREGFEPSVPLLTAHTISSRAPSASSDISPVLLNVPIFKKNSPVMY